MTKKVRTPREEDEAIRERIRDASFSASERNVNKNYKPIAEAKTPEARQKEIDKAIESNKSSDYRNLKTYGKDSSFTPDEARRAFKAAEDEKTRESTRGIRPDTYEAATKATDVVPMKKGGKVSSASKRADGIAQRGKTRGRMI